MRLRKVKKNKKLNGFQLKQQKKQQEFNRKNKVLKSFKVKDLLKLQKEGKIIGMNELMNDNYVNSTDNYLPLERIERKGRTIKKDNNGDVIVMVGTSNDVSENFSSRGRTKNLDGLTEMKVPMKDIVDYNSLWKITKSGWNSEGNEPLYPYINVDGKLLRWDNQGFRKDMGIYDWTTENQQKYMGVMFKQKGMVN